MTGKIKSSLIALSLVAASISSVAAEEGASSEFLSVLDDHWAWSLSQRPTFATSVGVRDFDDRLGLSLIHI